MVRQLHSILDRMFINSLLNGLSACTGKVNSISQDEAGSKSAFLSRAHDLMSAGGIVLLDRCNPTAEAREEVLTQLRLSPKQVNEPLASP